MVYHSPRPEKNRGSSLTSTLLFSQQAPAILSQQGLSQRTFMPNQTDTDRFSELEQLLFSCLQSTDDESALLCLNRLAHRFGPSNERVMALRGLYEEATAKDQPTLETCLHKYDAILSENPVNLPILKRRVALLQSLSKPADAISSLVQLLEAVPTDAEAWCELADLYQSEGMSLQAVFCLEEALLIVPNAWTVHARLGEILYIYAKSLDPETIDQYLHRSIQYFCRSIELCEDYLRGLYGLALATSPQLVTKQSRAAQGDVCLEEESLGQLHIFAKRRLASIVAEQYSREVDRREYGEDELLAVKGLLANFVEPL